MGGRIRFASSSGHRDSERGKVIGACVLSRRRQGGKAGDLHRLRLLRRLYLALLPEPREDVRWDPRQVKRRVTPTPDIDTAKSTTTREAVRKELDEWVKSGQRDRNRGETQVGG